MRSGSSISRSLVASALSATVLVLSACAGGPVTNARICSEIPFLDGPEGACVWTVSRKTELVSAPEWAKQRPTMLMIDAKSWTEIKKDWLKACRMAGPDCNVAVDSVDKVVKALDSIASQVMKP